MVDNKSEVSDMAPQQNVIKKRTIRSYVKRQGRITRAQEKALSEQWDRFGLLIEQGVLNIEQAFGRSAPTVLEIGFGNGKSLLQMASQQPEINFIGIEVHQPGVGSLLHDMVEFGVSDIRIYQQDAIDVLKQCINKNSLSKIQIFFPDPWPKKKHHKRRLIQADFINLLHGVLQQGGQLHMATDWQPYAEWMMQLMSAESGWDNMAGPGQFIANDSLRPNTKFEQRGQRLGHGVWDLLFCKS